MLKYTINGSECQELFLGGSNPALVSGKSYYRRKDISLSVRTEIALDLLERDGEYGVVMPLATLLGVSRTFLYHLKETARGALELALACGQPGRPKLSSVIEVSKNRLERGIVTLATVGCCSLEQTQRVLSEILDVDFSVGYISGVLKSAEENAAKVNATFVPCCGLTVAADEIFDGSRPHLVMVEPDSLLLVELSLKDHRDALTWGVTFLECAKNGVKIEKVVSDGAQGLKKGIAEAELGIVHQLDLFHTIREALRVEKSLERAAYQSIKREAERFQVIASAKSDHVWSKRFEQWEKAEAAVEKHIWEYETYHWLVSELREGLEFVTTSGGLRSANEMETLIEAVADLMLTIPHPKVTEVAERLQRQKGELVKYLEPLQEQLAELTTQVGDEKLVRLCLQEWRLEKEATCKGKRKGLERAVALPRLLETCKAQLQHWEEVLVKQVRETVRWLFGKVVRASSLVETVNSWLRPFLWRRKGNGRGIYNLLRLCWNTHRFARGKRKGKTPLELAGIEVSTGDWLELLGFAPKSSKV
jgi:hypothetical protein